MNSDLWNRLIIMAILILKGFGFFILGLWLLWEHGRGCWISLTEREPYRLDVVQFDATYKGQQLLEVVGYNLVEHSVQQPADNQGRYIIFVPFVKKEWKAGDPVHIVRTVGPMSEANAINWVANRRSDVQGMTTGVVAWQTDKEEIAKGMRVDLAPNALFLKDEDASGRTFAVAGFILGVVFSLVGGMAVRVVWLALRSWIKSTDEKYVVN